MKKNYRSSNVPSFFRKIHNVDIKNLDEIHSILVESGYKLVYLKEMLRTCGLKPIHFNEMSNEEFNTFISDVKTKIEEVNSKPIYNSKLSSVALRKLHTFRSNVQKVNEFLSKDFSDHDAFLKEKHKLNFLLHGSSFELDSSFLVMYEDRCIKIENDFIQRAISVCKKIDADFTNIDEIDIERMCKEANLKPTKIMDYFNKNKIDDNLGYIKSKLRFFQKGFIVTTDMLPRMTMDTFPKLGIISSEEILKANNILEKEGVSNYPCCYRAAIKRIRKEKIMTKLKNKG